jgi:hypothetical protein
MRDRWRLFLANGALSTFETMLPLTIQSILAAVLIVVFYAFTIVLSFVVVGTLAQLMKLDRRMPPKRVNFFVYAISAMLWLGFAFLVLNDWVAFMWNEYVRN